MKAKKRTAKPNGYVLYRNSTVVVIATGIRRPICGKCPHRGIKGKRARTCYVQVDRAPNGIYKAYKRGSYGFLSIDQYATVFAGKSIRLGAYGDPAVIPESIVSELCKVSTRHTGYTHQWRTAGAWLKPYVMASCDSLADYADATRLGWRTFRVTVGMTPQHGEILCPASAEAGARTQCARCGLCNGAGVAKNIYIPVHGASKKSAFTILQ